jgi:hypothetical protein
MQMGTLLDAIVPIKKSSSLESPYKIKIVTIILLIWLPISIISYKSFIKGRL